MSTFKLNSSKIFAIQTVLWLRYNIFRVYSDKTYLMTISIAGSLEKSQQTENYWNTDPLLTNKYTSWKFTESKNDGCT